jgi:nucleoside-diphosphate-sugar epimerase
MTGATGYIGSVIAEIAAKEGYDVHGLSRSEQGDERLQALGATPVRGDLKTLDVLSRESSEADIVLHLAWNHDFSSDIDENLRVDVAAVDAMATPLQGTNKPLIVSSGSGVVEPDPNGGETTEDDPPSKKPHMNRIAAENHSLSWAQKGVLVSIIRLAPFVYGRGGKGFTSLLMWKAFQTGESWYVGEGTNRMSAVHVDDAARLYLLVAQKSKKPGEIFNGCSSTTITTKEIATAVGNVMGYSVRSVTQEKAAGVWGSFLASIESRENRASGRKAREQLGWNPQGLDLVKDIQEGSYVPMAKRFIASRQNGGPK